jgi:hypothetical protein
MSILSKFKHTLKRNKAPLLLVVLVAVLAVGPKLSALEKQPFTSVEVSVAEYSPSGISGGAVVPASCPSYPHPQGEAAPTCPICSGTQTYGQVTQTWFTGDGSYTVTTDTCNECPAGQVATPDHTACCAGNYGQSCSGSNACGTLTGTYQCNGSCSVGGPTTYGSCNSAANACGGYNVGTNCGDGRCVDSGGTQVTTPANPAWYGQSCNSPANSCGQTTTGTLNCSNVCSATTAPPNSACFPDLTASSISPTSGSTQAPTTFTSTITNSSGGAAGTSKTLFQKADSGSVSQNTPDIFSKIITLGAQYVHAAGGVTTIGTPSTAAIPGNGNTVASISYTFPASDAGTTKYLRACADTNHDVGELDEGNNCGPWTAVAVAGLCSPPPPTFGQTCGPSAPNSCGQTANGTIQCDGSCNAVTPPESSCPIITPPTPPPTPAGPQLNLTANPTRVRLNGTTQLTWWAFNVTSCSLSGPSTSASATADSDGTITSHQTTSGAVTGQSTYTLTCQSSSGAISTSVTVNLIPNTIEI